MDSKTYEYMSERVKQYRTIESKVDDCNKIIVSCFNNREEPLLNVGNSYHRLPPGVKDIIVAQVEKYIAELKLEMEKI